MTAFIVESYKTLMPSTSDSTHTVLLLHQISQQLAGLSNSSTNVALPVHPPFQPTPSAVRVNAFWFLSLCFGLACALTATFVQQWARTYLQAIERRPAPHKKARIRAFLYEGMESFGMTTVVEGIPTLLHIAVFLFFAGLVDFLFAINHIVAYSTLAIVSVCAALYLFITFLPTIRHNSPYKTPLSGICWRILQFLGLLQYIDWSGHRKNIDGSMEQGREMLATEDLPGRDQRDQEALFWTMESLTDNIELEPFVEGIPAFVSDSGCKTASMIKKLMINKDIALMDRVVRLLMTCKELGVLIEDRRRKRAMTCFSAITALATISNTLRWTTYAIDEDLVRKLKSFETDKIIGLYAKAVINTIAKRMQSLLAATISLENPRARTSMQSTLTRVLPDGTFLEDFFSSTPEEVEQETLAKALRLLYLMDALPAMIEMIPDLIPSIEPSTASQLTATLLSSCQFFYIPQILLACKDPCILYQPERRTRVLACLRATYAIASHSMCHSTTVETIPHFRMDENLDIAAYATCTAARVACHLQSDIVCSMWQLSNVLLTTHDTPSSPTYRIPGRHDVVWESNHSIAGHYRKLDALDILHAFTESTFKSTLSRSLRLGVVEGLAWPDDLALHQWATLSKELIDRLPLEELQLLERLELRTSQGLLLRFRFSLPKLALSRGHIVILIAFLQSLTASPLPTTAAFGFVVETMDFLIHNLHARFSTRDAQSALVDVAGECLKHVHSSMTHTNLAYSSQSQSHSGYIHNIVDNIFNVLGTIGHPAVIDTAKQLINEYLALGSSCDSAIQALRKVKQSSKVLCQRLEY